MLQLHDGSFDVPINWAITDQLILQCFDAVGWAAGRASGL